MRTAARIVMLFTALCLLAAPAARAGAVSVGDEIAEGFRLVQSDDYGGALVHFERALAAEPRNTKALAGKAVCAIRLRRFEQAETLIAKVRQASPELATGLGGLLESGRLAEASKQAEALRQQGKVRAAVQTLLAIGPKVRPCPLYLFQLGALQVLAEQNAAGAATLRRSLTASCEGEQLTPQLVVAVHEALGVAVLRQRQWPQAQQEFETALQLLPAGSPLRAGLEGNLRLARDRNEGTGGRTVYWSWADVSTVLDPGAGSPSAGREPAAPQDGAARGPSRPAESGRVKPSEPAKPTSYRYVCKLRCGGKQVGTHEVVQKGKTFGEMWSRSATYDHFGGNGACQRHFGRPRGEMLAVDCARRD
ncbi:MAG: tetratricopeptide repeat protein [Deltaproteobacteria bacterium]|nr:tetratricopeptide repeat protein [Deltaproteobacteria bacterium]